MSNYYIDTGKILARAAALTYSRHQNAMIRSGYMEVETDVGGNTQIGQIGGRGTVSAANTNGGEVFKVYREKGANSRNESIITTNAKAGFARISSYYAQRDVNRVITTALGSNNMEMIPLETYTGIVGNESPHRGQGERILQRAMAHLVQADTEKSKYILKSFYADVEAGSDGVTGSTTTWAQDVDAFGGTGTSTAYTVTSTVDFASTTDSAETTSRKWNNEVGTLLGASPSMPTETGGMVYGFLPNTLFRHVTGNLSMSVKDTMRHGVENSDGTRNIVGNYMATYNGVTYVSLPNSWFDRQGTTPSYYVCPFVTKEALKIYAAHMSFRDLLFGNAVNTYSSVDEFIDNLFSREAESGLVDMAVVKRKIYEATELRDTDPIIKAYAAVNSISLADFYMTSQMYVNVQPPTTGVDSQSLVLEVRGIISAVRANPLVVRKLLVDPAKTPGLPAVLNVNDVTMYKRVERDGQMVSEIDRYNTHVFKNDGSGTRYGYDELMSAISSPEVQTRRTRE